MSEPSAVSGDGTRSIIFGENEAKRLVKILQQIAENLERQHIIDVKRILTDIVKYSKEDNQAAFDENVNKFVEIVIFKAGISVNLFKQAVRGFIMIKRQPHLGDLVSKLVSQLLAEEFPSLARIGEIDDETLRIYMKALEEGEEKIRHIRLMIIGMFGVGKTCIARRLCNEGINGVKTTVGIDLKLNVCEVDKEGKWFVRDEKSRRDKEFPKRLDKVMRQASSTRENMAEDSNDSEQQSVSSNKTSTLSQDKPIPQKENYDENIQYARNTLENSIEEDKPLMEEFKDTVKRFQTTNSTKPHTAPITKQRPRRSTTVSIWDFAGQSVYYSTHHFFLSSRSIYLLVLDISKRLDEMVSENSDDVDCTLLKGCMPEGFTCGDALRFWINSVYTYARDCRSPSDARSSNSIQYIPTIVLIGTHKDKLTGTEAQKEQYKDEYFRKALEPMGKNPARDYIHKEKFLIDCTEDSPEAYDKLRKRIIEIAQRQPFWKEPIPAKWIPLERTIEEEKSKGNNYMEFSELETKDLKNEFRLDDQKQIRLFLQFQHFFGNIIYYNVANLNKKIIMKPQWIIDMFKLFVTHHSTFEANDLEKMWIEYGKTAILQPALFQYLIENNEKSNDGSSTVEKVQLVQYILEHLDVMARPVKLQTRNGKEEDETAENPGDESLGEEDFFVVPSMLKKMTRTESEELRHYFQPDKKKASTTSVLCLVFENQFLPPAIFHRLLATCIRKWEPVMKSKEYLLYNGMGVFRVNHQQTLTIWYAEYVICMRISAFPANIVINPNACKVVNEEICNMLRHILLLDKQKKSPVDEDTDMSVLEPFGEYILCEESLEKSIEVMFKDPCESGLLEVRRLQHHESLYCECGENHGVSRSEALKYWYPEYVTGIVPQDPIQATKNYFDETNERYGSLDRVPDDTDLADISNLIGSEYRDLGYALGLTRPQLDRIKEDNPFKTSNRIMSILRAWQKMSSLSTFKELQDKMIRVQKNYLTMHSDT